jgi:hypothetical protein
MCRGEGQYRTPRVDNTVQTITPTLMRKVVASLCHDLENGSLAMGPGSGGVSFAVHHLLHR